MCISVHKKAYKSVHSSIIFNSPKLEIICNGSIHIFIKYINCHRHTHRHTHTDTHGNTLLQWSAVFFCNVRGLRDHMESFTVTELCQCNMKTAIDNKGMNGHSYVLIKLYLQKTVDRPDLALGL